MPAPPPRGKTIERTLSSFLDWQSYITNGPSTENYFPYPKSIALVRSVKDPNPLSPPSKPKGTWLPCKPYLRAAASYNPSGFCFGEDNKGAGAFKYRWSKVSAPKGNGDTLASITWRSVNSPYSDDGVHPWMDINTINRLQTECLMKVQSRKANYGEALAESRKTINHLADTATRVANLLLGIRRRDPKRIAKALGLGKKRRVGLSSSWLEYQYAWLPLMSDIYDTYGLLTKGFGERPQLIRAVRQLESTQPVDISDLGIRSIGDTTITDRCILFYKLNDSELAKYGQLGLINPLEVAWAVVPWSFVIDWFVPVGNFLQATTATIGLTFVDGCLSRSTRSSRTLTAYDATTRYPYNPDQSTWTSVNSFQSFERKRIASSPRPGLYMKNPFSTTHVISALALLTQLSRR